MAHTPLKSGSVDVVVFCLSLMGTNIKDFVTEANRVLKHGGIMKVAEVESRFTKIDEFLSSVTRLGFHCTIRRSSKSTSTCLTSRRTVNARKQRRHECYHTIPMDYPNAGILPITSK
nr:ribosomal RNA-processing protein 8-like [Penaeus vannamei]